MGSFDIQNPSSLETLQDWKYTLETPGPDPVYSTAPHPHEAITDPTQSFVLIPDLGADLIRLYRINKLTKLLEPLAPFQVPSGSGPRHATWLVTESQTYLYVVSQLSNVLTSYAVTYNRNQTISFSPLFSQSLLKTGRETDLQFYSAAAEIHITPDHNHLIVSQRNDTFFTIPDPTNSNSNSNSNSSSIPSDTLLTFSLDPCTGNFSLIDVSPAGGSFPRQFNINQSGDLVAVGLQNDGRVVVIERDVKTGQMGGIVAAIDVAGQVVCVVWNE